MLPQWTAYAQEMALRYVLNLSPAAAPVQLYMALFSTTADPATGLANELTDPSYHRQHVHFNTSGTTLFSCDTSGAPTFNFSAAGTFVGLRLMDTTSGAGNTLFWQDLDTEYDYTAGSTVPVLTNAIQVGLVNPV
jgi:hypothetical protein